LIGRPWGSDAPALPCVDLDNVYGGYVATARLLASGRRHVACVAGPDDMRAVADRRDGWRRALTEAGLTPGPLLHSPFTMEAGEATTDLILRDYPEVDAVFAQSDSLAAGVIRRLAAAGRSVPEQVAVVGYDDLGVAMTTNPQLTTVSNPAAEMARRATAMLLAELSGEPSGERLVLLTPRLVSRESG
jgi:DNA-binding LacI/PurR family transcriptional regulator